MKWARRFGTHRTGGTSYGNYREQAVPRVVLPVCRKWSIEDCLSGFCYRWGSLSQPLPFPVRPIIRQNGLSHHLELAKMPGARGIVTAFARILVSEPCQPLDVIAMLALAADNPSPDFPAIHPVLTCLSRRKGPLKATSMLHQQSIAIGLQQASIHPVRRPVHAFVLVKVVRRRGFRPEPPWRRSTDRMPPDPGKTDETL